VIANTLMVGILGVPPALASQRVHVVGIVLSITSAYGVWASVSGQ
jgi:hypothetical protein